ncbi:DNA polymerase III alpha subunit [Hasllibacter halocynthiae]|uniref:DNA polymerase III subunit alpha n=1 Tax=Hasllibacter halocynthiae TaxID=595589 RepID=A0A2T0X137_9RHOB|nr:DNA polymerase III subunit alpha [Hasllibacter halocynthiae]PRY92637.1 DNA polymerase III alpha subunit [Hasllibacter halocynthiae]
MSSPSFVHLRVHSEHSLLTGAIPAKALPKMAADGGMPAVALTDTNAMFAALQFSEGCAAAGVQPIVGVEIAVEHAPARAGEKPVEPAPLVLLAKDEEGYGGLMKLSSALYMPRHMGLPKVAMEEVERHAGGVICLTGGADGPAGRLIRAGKRELAEAHLRRLSAAFGDRLYVELQRHPGEDGPWAPEAATERAFVEMAYAMGLPLVATNDAHFANPALYEAHDALLAIREGAYVDQTQPRRTLTPQHDFKSPREMAALFADLPEALESTVEIARRCHYRPTTRAEILPRFAEDEVEELRRQSHEGLRARLEVIPHAAPVEKYVERLDYELSVIEGMGFPGYFLIVADFIKWAKDEGIPVGPGRGSGAGSLVAYALTITDLDPLRYDLLFERFLNPDRISMPDFDIDFCMDRREEVIDYVREKYGADRVGQIITFGALLSKAAVRDVGRVLQMPFGQTDRLSKMIPVEGVKPVSIDKALADEPRLREEARDPAVARLMDYCGKLEGLLRNASTHAAGVVIGDRPLDELVPVYRDPKSDMPATQFNMKWVEKAGLVKFDFLGLKTLTQIRNALDILKEQGEPLIQPEDVARLGKAAQRALGRDPYDISAIPLDDRASYDLYASGKTVAVFQVESAGMIDALRRMRPTCIEDIVALVALYRPGPMENIPQYCDVKNGRAERARLHPLIDDILDETQGIIVYQEQVMEIARKMAGYTLGGADLLRRAMGKKIQAEMDAQRPLFLEGAKKNGVDERKALEVWDLLDKFANYGFNKSHAAAYGVVSYQTAWLKANHPVAFMAGIMNSDIHLTEKLAVYAEDVRRNLKIEIVPPCVNRSAARFTTDVVETGEKGRIVYALGALKNVGVEAMEMIVAGRDGRPFATLYDLARRVDLKRVGKRPLEMLARAGAFDQLDPNRRRVLGSLDALVAYSAAVHEQRASAQVSLFGEAGEDLPEPRLAPVEDWLPAERLAEEHVAIGFYLSGHPLDDYMGGLRRSGVATYEATAARANAGTAHVAKIAGTVASRQERMSARGNRFAFVQLSDPTGLYEVRVFSEALERDREHLSPGTNVVLTVEASAGDGRLDLICRAAAPVDTAAGTLEELMVYADRPEAVEAVAALLARLRNEAARARADITLRLMDPGLPGEVEMSLGADWPVSPQVRSALKSLPGVVMVE